MTHSVPQEQTGKEKNYELRRLTFRGASSGDEAFSMHQWMAASPEEVRGEEQVVLQHDGLVCRGKVLEHTE